MLRRLILGMTFAATLTVGPRLAAVDTSPDKLRPIDLELRVPGKLADVWHAWTTNDGAQRWFAPKTNIELRAGGPFEILFMPDNPPGTRGAEDLKVITYLPQEMLTFEWNAPPQFAKARAQRTWVVVRFADEGDGTVRVGLTHLGFAERVAEQPDMKAEYEQVRDYFSKAWPRVLEHLREQFAKTSTPNLESQVTEGIVEAPLDQVWAAFTTKQGLESWMVAHAEIDLRVGGRMLTHYSKEGVIGDPGTIENLILAYEPQRMLTIKVGKPPERFPYKEAVKNVWHVLTFEEAGPGRTRVREVGVGYGSDEESQKLRKFFEAGNAYTLKRLQEHLAKKQ
jgi:uncharacterized protein YndB with AHSA1/START domain